MVRCAVSTTRVSTHGDGMTTTWLPSPRYTDYVKPSLLIRVPSTTWPYCSWSAGWCIQWRSCVVMHYPVVTVQRYDYFLFDLFLFAKYDLLKFATFCSVMLFFVVFFTYLFTVVRSTLFYSLHSWFDDLTPLCVSRQCLCWVPMCNPTWSHRCLLLLCHLKPQSWVFPPLLARLSWRIDLGATIDPVKRGSCMTLYLYLYTTQDIMYTTLSCWNACAAFLCFFMRRASHTSVVQMFILFTNAVRWSRLLSLRIPLCARWILVSRPFFSFFFLLLVIIWVLLRSPPSSC